MNTFFVIALCIGVAPWCLSGLEDILIGCIAAFKGLRRPTA